VWRPKDLESLDPKVHAGRIAHTVGENKRVQILEDAKKANIRILNPGLKRPAEVVPEIPPEPTTTEPTPETREPEKKETKPAKQKPKEKAKPKTTRKRKSDR
jgi:outer membrane biosynthesis protein TonB